jgi:hypothetical protein
LLVSDNVPVVSASPKKRRPISCRSGVFYFAIIKCYWPGVGLVCFFFTGKSAEVVSEPAVVATGETVREGGNGGCKISQGERVLRLYES